MSRSSEYSRLRRNKARDAGLCTTCCKTPRETGSVRCQPCNENHRKSSRGASVFRVPKFHPEQPRTNSYDLTGHVFGRLTAIERYSVDIDGSYLWRCRCECGTELNVRSGNLRNGSRQSCGCARRESRELIRKERTILKLEARIAQLRSELVNRRAA